MTEENYRFASADGVSQIHGVRWLPDGEPTAVLQLVHGMVEYIERYREFATYLTARGFAVVGHDHIGHGHTAASLDELGIMHARHPSDVMVEDIYANYVLNKERYAGVPYYILGHSMGSYMTRKCLCVKAAEMTGLAGAIIMGTGTESSLTIYGGLALINVLALFHADDYRSEFLRRMMQYKQFDNSGMRPENSWLTKDTEIVRQYYASPYCTFGFSLSAYRGLVESTIYDNKMSNIARMNKDLPVLFISGDQDPVGNMGKGVQAAYDKFVAAGMRDVTIRLYQNDRHEILNETDRATVYQDLYAWMQDKGQIHAHESTEDESI